MNGLNRREFLEAMGLLLAFPAATVLSRDKPNLLIIHTDEHNFRTLGCYRKTLSPDQAFMWGKDAVVETPHIDSIAREGAICTKFYATTPVCSPSRASFMTGRYPQNTDVVKNDIPMRDDMITFAEVLGRNGYETGYAGKWHLDGKGKPQWAPDRRFGFTDNRYMYNRGHWKQLEKGPRVKAQGKKGPTYSVEGADETSFTTDFLADRAVEFMEKNKKKPFCYMISIPDPHGPDTVRPPYDTMYEKMTFEKPRTFDKPDENVPGWAKKQKGGYGQSKYFGMVKCIDDNVGKLLDCLQRNGLMEKTIVVFTADHGDLRGEHHRHNKGVPLEASAKVPFVIRYPGAIKPGTTVRQALGTVDFMPTVLALMGAAPSKKVEGRDASPLFTSSGAPEGWQDITFTRGTGHGGNNWLAAFTSRYKLVVSPEDPPWLLDLEQDPDELKNFCFDPEHRETVRTLAVELIAYGKKFKDPRVDDAKMAADLEWCAAGEDPYPQEGQQK